MKEVYKESELVRWLVIMADFIVLNIILLLAVELDCVPKHIFFGHAIKIAFFVANVSLFIAETCFSSIIHVRKIDFRNVFARTFKLLFTTILFFNLIMAYLLKSGYDLIKFTCYFAIALYVIFIISRYLELYIIKYYRSRGRNSKTVMFIGNDPAILEMYDTMMEDSSAGYKIFGYYANNRIGNSPKDLKYLGSMDTLNKIMDAKIRLTAFPAILPKFFAVFHMTIPRKLSKSCNFAIKMSYDSIIFQGNSANTNSIWTLCNI